MALTKPSFYHQQAFESYGRYCSQSTKAQDGDGYADGQTREYIGAPKRYCYLYQSNRPFNGKRVAERRHPWCDAWTDSGSKELVCSETANGTKSCENLASANFESSNRLVCSSWSLPTTSCDEAYDYYDLWEGPNESVQLENLGKEREYISFGIQLPPAVYGVECVLPIKKSGEINE